KRVVDASVADLTVAVKPFYKADVERPKSVVVRAKIGNGKMVEAPIESLPMTIMVPIKDVPGPTSADLRLVVEILADGNVLASRGIGVGRVENLATRVEAIKKAAKSVPNPPTTIEQASFVLLSSLVDDLAKGKVLETDYPASRLVFGGERLAKVTEPYYITSRPGVLWLRIPVGAARAAGRIILPPYLADTTQPPPLP